MTRLEVISMIGDIITEIDVARGSLLFNDPNRHKLDDLRLLLDDRQRKISQAVFNDNTQAFQAAAQNLKAVEDQIKGTIRRVENIITVLDNTKRFLDAVTSLTGAVGPFL